ncbi:MAG: bifunctional phosphoglucose/phosphomannose isomerase [Candidatus Moranbacteria bacterium CG_4_9_14_3_um_filter_40_7]|nr:MAG: bifunctional phosphoglucose/phosphomannose isomerase [Candidatus Moranbacteria bacterium CG23_combo_of_CG06-09_8_20_14_all_40_16]PIU80774.1 MAG: bifunctional phosphoglucose/phosphomannose isomerase [Candidatus Moranbacteria bacterium CG06_land_8_20_14_3_00_40_12]PJA87886.1 MAG: bifunctional phosphoglucose/phosphomannose isomerase [Candidatus Moranbacteria bacterium CG_4_9_14_3_um_filter_40_7]
METKIKELDRSNFRQVILDSHQQLLRGIELAEKIKVSGNFSRLVISGMGGSALPGELLQMYLSQLNKNPLEIYLNRAYSLPPQSFQDSFNFFVSYSGNTEETLSSFNEAWRKNLSPLVGFSTGGKLKKIFQKNDLPLVIIPSGIEPRCAIGYFFSSILKVLTNSGLIRDEIPELLKVAQKLKKEARAIEKLGKALAQKIKGRTPVVYASDFFRPLAMIWKIALNENAKTPAFYNVYPELNHNEMIGYTLPQGQFHILTLRSRQDHPRIQKRMRLTAELLQEKGVETTFIEIPAEHIFNTIFYTLILGEWISYYLALGYDQDPAPVVMVEKLKGLLK